MTYLYKAVATYAALCEICCQAMKKCLGHFLGVWLV